MMRKPEDCRVEIREHARGGEGKVVFHHLLESEEYNNRGRLLGRIVLEPGASIGPHTHQGELEFYYFLSGTASVVDNGIRRQLHPGEVLLTRDGESHSIRNDHPEDLEYLAFILKV